MLKARKWVSNRFALPLVLCLVCWGVFAYVSLGTASAANFAVSVYQTGPGDSRLAIAPYVLTRGDIYPVAGLVPAVVDYSPITSYSSESDARAQCQTRLNNTNSLWIGDIGNIRDLIDGNARVLEFPLGRRGFTDGDMICVVAKHLPQGSGGGQLAYAIYKIKGYKPPESPELNPKKNSENPKKRSSGSDVGSLVYQGNNRPDYRSFPRRDNLNWESNSPSLTTGATRTTSGGSTYTRNLPTTSATSWGGLETVAQDSQHGRIILSTDACKPGWVKKLIRENKPLVFDPTDPAAVLEATGHGYPGHPGNKDDVLIPNSICSPQVYLNLDAVPGRDLELKITDLCINGWDRSNSNGVTTFQIFKVNRKTKAQEEVRNATIRMDHTKYGKETYPNGVEGYGNNCYKYYLDNQTKTRVKVNADGTTTIEPSDEARVLDITLLDANHNNLIPRTGRENVRINVDTDPNTASTPTVINSHAVHVHEFIKLDGDNITEDDFYVISARITKGFNVFSLEVDNLEDGPNPDHGRITFDNNINPQVTGTNRKNSILAVSNNTYYSNQHSNYSWNFYKLANKNPWKYSVIIAAPCDHEDFITRGLTTTRQGVGLFDSDITGDRWGFPTNTHKVKIFEADRVGGWPDDLTPFVPLTGGVPDHTFNGIANRESDNTDIAGNSVARNGTELYHFDFAIDKIYKIEFSGIHHRNFIQFVLPFGQYPATDKCENTPPEVMLDSQCNLRLKSVDWSHPSKRETPSLINFDILHEKGPDDTTNIVRTPGTPAKEYKLVASHLMAANPQSSGGVSNYEDYPVILPFKPNTDDPAAPSWFNLIKSNEIKPNPNKWEQVQFTGFYDDQTGDLHSVFDNYSLSVRDSSFQKVQAEGHGELKLREDGNLLGNYYFLVNLGDTDNDPNTPDQEERIPSSGYCTWTEFSAIFDNECNIDITKLIWSRPNRSINPDPDLRVTIKRHSGTNGEYIHSIPDITQPITPPNSERLIDYNKDPLNPTKISISDLLARSPPEKRIIPGGGNNLYYLQLTGRYETPVGSRNKKLTANLPMDGNTSFEKDYESGRIAGSGDPGPPIMLFYVDNTNPDITKIKYGNYRLENGNLILADEGLSTAPTDPDEACNEYGDDLEVRFVRGPNDPDACDLRLVSGLFIDRNNDEPQYIQLEISYDPNWSNNLMEDTSKAPTWKSSFRVDQTAKPATIIEWVDNNDPSKVTFKSLIDGGFINTGSLGSSGGVEWIVKLVGYYDSNNIFRDHNYSGFNTRRTAGDRVVVDGDSEFEFMGNALVGHYVDVAGERIPNGIGEYCPINPLPEPELEIEFNDDCEIIITKLNWSNYEDDHDNNASTNDDKLASSNKFIVEIGEVDKDGNFRKINSTKTKKRFSGSLPQTYFEFTSSTPGTTTLKALLDDRGSGLDLGKTYEVRLIGFTSGSSDKNFKRIKPVLAKRNGGQGRFSIGEYDGKYRIYLDNDDYVSSLPAPNDGCLNGPGDPFVEISINNNCDIIIDRIGWPSNDGHKHDLQLTFSPNAGIRRGHSSTPSTIYAYNRDNQPYGDYLDPGPYTISLTGYFDEGDRGVLKVFSARSPTLSNSYIPTSGVTSFEIKQTTTTSGPAYHIEIPVPGGTPQRIPAPTPIESTPYCKTPPPPPCTTNLDPKHCRCRLDSSTWFANWTNGATDDYGTLNSIWYEGSPGNTIDPANDKYGPYVPIGLVESTRPQTSGFTTDPGRQTFYVIPSANQPNKNIPGTATITHQDIIDDLIDGGTSGSDGFEYYFSNDSSQVNRRDSVWALFGNNYKPKTSVKWNEPAVKNYNGLGRNNGWANTFDLRIQPVSLIYENDNPRTTVINGRGSSSFNPTSTTTKNSFVDFTTRNDQTRGNSQTDDLLAYEWKFYWKIDVTHRHTVEYERWDKYISKKAYETRSGSRNWITTTWIDDNGTPHDPDDDVEYTTSGWGPWTYSGWSTAFTVGQPASNPSGSGGGPSDGWVVQVQNIRPVEWAYQKTDLTEPETRKTTLTGTLLNCSYVLIIRPPICNVRRREWSSDAETKPNPAGTGPDRSYEIFPPGKPDYFSQLRMTNNNPFELEPTSPQTKATLKPTLNLNHRWYPRDNNNNQIAAAGVSVDPKHYNNMDEKPYGSGSGAITTYEESNITPQWPGEYRLNWVVGWEALAKGQYPNRSSDYADNYRGTSYHEWQGDEPPTQSLTCSDPTDGIYVYVSADPPVCKVNKSIFEFSDPDTRLEIGLQNPNWVDLQVPRKTVATRNSTPWPNAINAGRLNLSPYGPTNYELPQGYEAERPTGATRPAGIPNPIAGDATGLTGNLVGGSYPGVSDRWLDIISDNRMALMPAPLGEYTFHWDLRARRGIEWWSTTDTGKLPLDSGGNPAWWAGDNSDERILENGSDNDCEEITLIVRIPFVKAFLGGMSAGGRFGLGDEFDSCKNENWLARPTAPQGVWGHSINTKVLTQAIGSSVEQALRAQKVVGGVYSSSLEGQLAAPNNHTNVSSVESKALTFANTNAGYGGEFSNVSNPSWRCLPNYWRIPDNANQEGSGQIPGLRNFAADGAARTPQSPAGLPNANRLGGTADDGVALKDGHVLYIDGDLHIDGDLRDGTEEDLRVSIFVKGDVIITGDIENNTNLGKKYHGFSDMGLIQIIAYGNIEVQPQVNRIDATLVAYPHRDTLEKGAIDLCASQTSDNKKQHYEHCASDAAVPATDPRYNRQLVINGALVAQRIYFNRLNETLENTLTPTPAHPQGQEPPMATYGNTKASEVIVLMPEYHFVTPAASVFDDWIKRPQAIFDIPASL